MYFRKQLESLLGIHAKTFKKVLNPRFLNRQAPRLLRAHHRRRRPHHHRRPRGRRRANHEPEDALGQGDLEVKRDREKLRATARSFGKVFFFEEEINFAPLHSRGFIIQGGKVCEETARGEKNFFLLLKENRFLRFLCPVVSDAVDQSAGRILIGEILLPLPAEPRSRRLS